MGSKAVSLKSGELVEGVVVLNLDGTVSRPSNVDDSFRDAFEAYSPTSGKWNEVDGSADMVFLDGNTLGASYIVISKDPWMAGTETFVETGSKYPIAMPVEVAIGLHMSQRTLGQDFSVELVDTDAPDAMVADIAIAAISQAASVLTIDTVAPHNLVVGKAIGVFGCSNALANYPSLVVASIPSPTQITCTAGPGGTIASQTITNPAGAKGSIYFRSRFGRAKNGVSQIFENATATNASLYVRSESGDALPSGTALGNQATTIGSTASVQLANTAYAYAFVPSNEFRLVAQADRVQWSDSALDTVNQSTSRLVRSQVCPNPDRTYKLRFRAVNNKALTVPVAQIISATKTGTTTATVVTDRPHGLALNDPVVIYGARDFTNFASLATATLVASVVDATTFTIVWGGAVTATTYGGYVARVNGGNLMSSLGAIAQVVQSAVLSTLSDGTRQLVLTGSAAWAGMSIGDMVNVAGCRDAVAGVTLGLDGGWKVANIVTTALTLVLPYAGSLTLPADFGLVNCGGGIIKRTDMRISWVRVFNYDRLRVEAMPRPAGDMAMAIPMVVAGGSLNIGGGTLPTVTTVGTVSALTGGGAAEDAAAGANPVVVGGVVQTATGPITLVAGDAVRDRHAVSGAKITRPYAPPETSWNYGGLLTTTTAVAAATAAGASLKRFPVALQAINVGAAAVDLIILDGATERWRITLPVNVPIDCVFPIELLVTANTALNVNLSAVSTGVRVNLQGYTAP